MNKQSFLPASPILGNVIRTRGYISRFRAAIIAIGIFALLHFYFFSLSPGTPSTPSPLARLQNSTSANSDNDNGNECDTISKGLSRVVITIHTGATEVLDQIPTQMRTTLRCAPNILIFSDMSHRIGPWEIHDALSSIAPSVTVDNTDFDLYRKQQALRDPVKIASILKDFKDPQREDDLAAWTLAKYKNVPIVRKAWELKPDMDWYFHVDADTYVMLPSLVKWIETLDPRKERFFGSLIFINDQPFAHGGSGVLLSNAATRTFVEAYDRNGTAQHWDEVTRNECCGDFVLGRVLESCGINVTDAVPTINGDNPETIPFGPDHWCQPVVTMHHVSPAQREQLIQFEQRRKHPLEPVLYAELFKDLVFDTIPTSLEDWDNMSDDEHLDDKESAEDCERACDENENCLQSLFSDGKCSLGTNNIRVGKLRRKEGEQTWTSSWNRPRIDKWASKQKGCNKVRFATDKSWF